MRSLKSLLLVSVALILVSCSMSAKTEKNETEKTAARGEVIALNKADFLSKVYNSRRTRLNGYTKEINRLSLIFMLTGAVLAKKFLRSWKNWLRSIRMISLFIR